DTQLTFEPDQGVNTTLAMPGQFVEIPQTTNSFKVSSNNKILVAQYMVGQGANFGTSDPAMLVAVATEQYRTNYLFHAPTGWSGNYVDIIAPDGVSVNVDGAPVMAFAPIGATGFSVAHVKLNNNGDGNHTVESAAKIGISVYGVLNYGSYWYPGGLDLALIPE
ncbi:MAG: IgGFc-binding protein, partial [Myxococcales bacterium]|nr:IgGFc-binding protein [Myxococcales bacterium]